LKSWHKKPGDQKLDKPARIPLCFRLKSILPDAVKSGNSVPAGKIPGRDIRRSIL